MGDILVFGNFKGLFSRQHTVSHSNEREQSPKGEVSQSARLQFDWFGFSSLSTYNITMYILVGPNPIKLN